ncbi:hypothetical protein V8C34DRAFT_272254 [Trichoderma compactum]
MVMLQCVRAVPIEMLCDITCVLACLQACVRMCMQVRRIPYEDVYIIRPRWKGSDCSSTRIGRASCSYSRRSIFFLLSTIARCRQDRAAILTP